MQRLGHFELHAVSDGFFKLDGGAMFGIVPRPLWEKHFKPDDQHRIRLALTCLLIRTGSGNVLVDTGMGDKYDEKWRRIYDLDRAGGDLLSNLRATGVGPEEITHVVITHLHVDHAGGATQRRPDGRVVPTFPKAVHVIQRIAWDEALNTNERTAGSYRREDFLPLEEFGRIRLVEGEAEVVPGVRVERTGGHIPGHQVVIAESEGRRAVFFGDVMPTTAHLKPAWVMGFDLDPAGLVNVKKRMVERAVTERWLCCWEHDPRVKFGYLKKEGEGITVEPMEIYEEIRN